MNPSLTLLIRPDLGKMAYRLKCRFVIASGHGQRELEQAKYKAADWFIKDMHKEGWEYIERYGFRLRGPFPATPVPVTIRRKAHLSAKNMIDQVRMGARFLADNIPIFTVPLLEETDKWEYELAGVFMHKTILVEVPDIWEEQHG